MLLKVLLNLQYKQQMSKNRKMLKVFNNNNDKDR